MKPCLACDLLDRTEEPDVAYIAGVWLGSHGASRFESLRLSLCPRHAKIADDMVCAEGVHAILAALTSTVSAAVDTTLHKSARASLVRGPDGALYVISPAGRRLPMSANPDVVFVFANWLEISVDALCRLVDSATAKETP